MSGERRCIVVGAGLLGLATAWSLSRRAWHVTVVEAAGTIGHARSGSKGSARIFRLGYPDPLYVELALAARRMWGQLEREAGRALLDVRGQLTFGDDAALENIATAMAGAGAPARHLSPAEVAREYPSMSLGETPVLFEPESGVLRAGACLEAFCVAGTFTVRTDAPVVALDNGEGNGDRAPSVLLASGERCDADVIVDCAGPRTLALAQLRPSVSAPPSLPQVAYFAPKDAGAGAAAPPVFIEWGDDMIYGLPVPARPGETPLYKVSHHTPGKTFDGGEPSDADLSAEDAPRLARLCSTVDHLVPALNPVPVSTERCVYDNSADTDFVLDRVGNIVVGCGTSGHAFKFGPVLGALLADLAEGVTPAFDLGRFALGRSRPENRQGTVVR